MATGYRENPASPRAIREGAISPPFSISPAQAAATSRDWHFMTKARPYLSASRPMGHCPRMAAAISRAIQYPTEE